MAGECQFFDDLIDVKMWNIEPNQEKKSLSQDIWSSLVIYKYEMYVLILAFC